MFYQVVQDKMQDKVEQVIDDSKKNRDMFAEKCNQHAMEYLQYFCSACNSVCCHICSHDSHKGCDSVEFIPNIVEGYDETNEFRDFYQKIGYLQFVLEKDKEKNKENVKTLQNSSTDALKALKAQRRDINRIFDQLEQAVKSENLAKSDGRIDKLQELAEENKNLCLMLRNLKRDLNQKANNGYTCQLFVGVKKSKDELEKMKIDIEKLVRKSKVSRYVYVPDSEILCQLKTMQHLGSIKETKPAQVLHPYSTITEKGEVNLHVGAVINVIEEVNAEWWTGEHKGQIFQFPANYVIKTQVEERKKAKVLYPYVAKPGKDELNLLQGEIISVIRQDSDGWWEGERNGLIGVFPGAYVELLDDLSVSDTSSGDDFSDSSFDN